MVMEQGAGRERLERRCTGQPAPSLYTASSTLSADAEAVGARGISYSVSQPTGAVFAGVKVSSRYPATVIPLKPMMTGLSTVAARDSVTRRDLLPVE